MRETEPEVALQNYRDLLNQFVGGVEDIVNPENPRQTAEKIIYIAERLYAKIGEIPRIERKEFVAEILHELGYKIISDPSDEQRQQGEIKISQIPIETSRHSYYETYVLPYLLTITIKTMLPQLEVEQQARLEEIVSVYPTLTGVPGIKSSADKYLERKVSASQQCGLESEMSEHLNNLTWQESMYIIARNVATLAKNIQKMRPQNLTQKEDWEKRQIFRTMSNLVTKRVIATLQIVEDDIYWQDGEAVYIPFDKLNRDLNNPTNSSRQVDLVTLIEQILIAVRDLQAPPSVGLT